MRRRASELVLVLLERYDPTELPAPVERILLRLLSGAGEATALIRAIAQASCERAQRILDLMEARMLPYALDRLQQEIYLVEDEQEAEALAAGCDREALEAHIVVYSLLPQNMESSIRRHRVLALALAKNEPVRAAAFIGEFNPRYEIMGFWRSLRLRLAQQVKSLAPLAAVPLLDRPEDAYCWLLSLLGMPDAPQDLIAALVARLGKLGLPTEPSLPGVQRLIEFLARSEAVCTADLLCLLAVSGSRPMPDRAPVLLQILEAGRALPESEHARLAEAVRKDGVPYLRVADRREVLRRLARFARHCPPEIQREIRRLRATAQLVHLPARRLNRAGEWAHAYDKRFQKRLHVVRQERERLLLKAGALLERLGKTRIPSG